VGIELANGRFYNGAWVECDNCGIQGPLKAWRNRTPNESRIAKPNAAGLVARISEYLQLGGLFNPEMMEHDKVRELLMDCRAEMEALLKGTDE